MGQPHVVVVGCVRLDVGMTADYAFFEVGDRCGGGGGGNT